MVTVFNECWERGPFRSFSQFCVFRFVRLMFGARPPSLRWSVIESFSPSFFLGGSCMFRQCTTILRLLVVVFKFVVTVWLVTLPVCNDHMSDQTYQQEAGAKKIWQARRNNSDKTTTTTTTTNKSRLFSITTSALAMSSGLATSMYYV